MTTDAIARLRALLDAATPHPWKRDGSLGCKEIGGGKSGTHRQARYLSVAHTVGLFDEARDAANADLIVALRNTAPLLLAVADAGQSLRAANSNCSCYERCECREAAMDALCDALDALNQQGTP